jgi:hydrogenase maturation protease
MDPAAVFATLTALGGTAPRTIVIGCEVENIEEGMGLSEPVAAAVPAAVAAINDVVADLAAPVTTPAEG